MIRTHGDYEKAEVVYEECLSLSQEIGDLLRESVMYQNLGFVAVRKGDYQWAKTLCRQSMQLALQIKSPQIAATIMVMAGVYAPHHAEKGARLMGAAEAMLDSGGLVLQPADKIEIVQYQSDLRELLGETAYEELTLEGHQMNMEEVVALMQE
jgi:hypothetical protein